MKRRQVLINAVMSVLQTIVIGLTMFLLYRFLLKAIGVEKLGIWSLVLASSSVGRIANLGLSGSVVKFVAKYSSHNDRQNVARVVLTAFMTTAFFIGIALLVLYPIARRVLPLFVPDSSLSDALTILPIAMLSVWLSTLASVLNGGLDGLQRVDLRSTVLMAGMILYALFSVYLVERYGLLGLAYAQLLQYLCTLGAAVGLLRHLIGLPMRYFRWHRPVLMEMMNYGVSFQVNSLLALLYEPITKALISHFGGLSLVGYYEMASRLIIQLRGLVVMSNQVLVPTFASLVELKPRQIKELYHGSLHTVIFLSLPLYTLIVAYTPIISIIWIGSIERHFVTYALLLAAGWLVNTLSGPSYFAYLGYGRLRWNTLSHAVIAVLNLCLGWVLGSAYGGTGAVSGWIIALMLGSSISLVAYHSETDYRWGSLATRSNKLLVLGSIAILVVAALEYRLLIGSVSPQLVFLIVTGSIVFLGFVPFWKHPIRKRLQNWMVDAGRRGMSLNQIGRV